MALYAVAFLVGLLSIPLDARSAEPDGQYIRNWLVAGPVPAETVALAADLAAASESLPAPEEGRSFHLPGGNTLRWNLYSAPGSLVNLNHALGPHEHGCALVCATIHAEQAGQVKFLLGSSDGVAILLNRRVVYLDGKQRPFCPDQDSFTATLQAGENECLAVVGRGDADWSFSLRVSTGDTSSSPPLIRDAVDILEQTSNLNSPHWRYWAGDDAACARADYDDSRWLPLSSSGEAIGVRNAKVVWFRCPVWIRPSLVNVTCNLQARHRGDTIVYLDGVRSATMTDAKSIICTFLAPFSFSAQRQTLAVRIERPRDVRAEDACRLRMTLSPYQADVHNMQLRVHRLIIIAMFAMFLVFHIALMYFYPRRSANREFCLTLAMALLTMIVLHMQEGSEQPFVTILYWIFLPLPSLCMLFGLMLMHALSGDRVGRGTFIAWTLLAAVLYGAACVRGDRTLAQVFAPLITVEYVRIYIVRLMGKVRGWPLYGAGVACFVALQAVFILREFTRWEMIDTVLPYAWVYGFMAFLASVSAEIGREFAGAVRNLEDLTTTLDARVQQVTQQLETKLLAQARLETLRYQLNPHFLYNALNSVEALSREGPSEIPEVVRSLSECLRYALHPKKSGMATLRQELQQVNSYLHVERTRFGENLVVESDIPDAVQQAIVPEFLLQPLLENAIKYGMRTSEIPLRVQIRANETNNATSDMLEVEVRNTGHWFRDAGNTDGGVGLENLQNRLNLLYGDQYRLTMTEDAGWVSVAVAIPLKHEDNSGVPSSKL